MSTLKYKARDRYAVGWTDPRVMVGGDTGHINIGAYRLAELYHVSDEVFDILHRTSATPHEIARVNKKEFAACIEAFLQEKKDGESNTVQRGDQVGLDTRHSAGESEGQV